QGGVAVEPQRAVAVQVPTRRRCHRLVLPLWLGHLHDRSGGRVDHADGTQRVLDVGPVPAALRLPVPAERIPYRVLLSQQASPLLSQFPGQCLVRHRVSPFLTVCLTTSTWMGDGAHGSVGAAGSPEVVTQA